MTSKANMATSPTGTNESQCW